MLKKFLQDTLDLLLDLLAALGLLRGGSAWYKARLARRLENSGRRAENLRRAASTQHRMCPSCRSLVAARESICPTCGASLRSVPRPGVGRVLRSVVPSFGSVSTTLLGLIAAIYLAGALVSPAPDSMLAPSGEILNRLGAMHPYWLIYQGQWWRVVNPIFLHGGLLHVGFNCYVLSAIGPLIEAATGRRRFLVLFVGTGIVSFVFSAAWALVVRHWSLGASGALFGLIGYGIVAGFRSPGGFLRQVAPRLAMWALINFLLGLGLGFVDNAAHLGGLLAGAASGLVIGGEPSASPGVDRLWTLAAWAAGILPVVGFALALLAAPA